MPKAVASKVIGILALSLGCGSVAFATGWSPSAHFGTDTARFQLQSVSTTSAPEIDPAGALSGLTLLAGGLAVVRGRRSKK